MKVAICDRKGSFSDYWKIYCEEKGIPFKIVDVYRNDILEQIADCDSFMWHFSHLDYKDALFAKQLLYSIEFSGRKVFPDFRTVWHFDDKLGQKYLFEAIGAPLVPTYVFYTKEEALDWINRVSLPKVFKLRGGAGASNVCLVRNKKQGINLINKAFGGGFEQYSSFSLLKERYRKFCRKEIDFTFLFKSFLRCFIKPDFLRLSPKEKGYVYFQDFIPGNETDTRIVVVGNKIIGERRGVRKGDFRASGSHILLPDVSKVDIRCVKLAYELFAELKLQIGVFDFIHHNGMPLVVEVSYGTDPDYTECEGYWDEKLTFVHCPINLPEMIIENFLNLH